MNFLQVFVLQWLKLKRFHNQTTPPSQPAASGNLENNLHTLCTAMSACEKGSWQTSLSLLRYLRGALSATSGFVVSLALYCFFLGHDGFFRCVLLWVYPFEMIVEKNAFPGKMIRLQVFPLLVLWYSGPLVLWSSGHVVPSFVGPLVL